MVNDLGSSASGVGEDQSPAQEVVNTIKASGGDAVVNTGDDSNWNGAKEMLQQSIDTFGRLEILVDNAGILRDRLLVNISKEEWDIVIKVHLKGTFTFLHHAANCWGTISKAGRPVVGRVINITSHSALFADIGQANCAAAKGGIATLSQPRELSRIGGTVNAIARRANTRMTKGLREYTVEQVERRDPERSARRSQTCLGPRVRGLGLWL